MGASITLAGESLIAQKIGAQQPLIVSRFVLANVPGLNPNSPVNRAAGKPAAGQIVGSYAVTQKGFVNPNQVVYSLMMGSDIGDFDWNWIGLETAENVLLAVAYVPVQQKRRNIPPLQLGNNVTRNFLVVFDGAQALTGITIDASTWQHDFTVRLKGIDERERLSNRDVYGRACFFKGGFQVEKVGSAYQLKPGQAYVEGVRLLNSAALAIVPTALPTSAWLDVALERQLSDVVASWKVVFGTAKVDYLDSTGTQHYCVPLADLSASAVADRRVVESIEKPLVQHFAARDGDYASLRARATTKDDVGLGNLPNALSDDDTSNSSIILATTKAVNAVRTQFALAIQKLIDGTTPAGKAKRLETARKIAISGAGTGSVQFDGSADVNLALTLGDTGIKAGAYTKITVNAKGLATTGENPTTLAGYSITDAYTSQKIDELLKLKAPLSSPALNGTPTAPTPAPENISQQIATTAFVQTAIAKKANSADVLYTGRSGTLSSLEVVSVGGTPYIDFSAEEGLDYRARIILTRDNSLLVDGVGVDGLKVANNVVWNAGNLDPEAIVPAGAILPFVNSSAPPGYLKANGAAVSRVTYARLFQRIGTFYGAGNGTTTFNLPDLRGCFIRGLDEGIGRDPNRALGTIQGSQNLSHTHAATSDAQGEHTHALLKSAGSNNSPGGYVSPANAGNATVNTEPAGRHTHTITVQASGGNESRPVNIALVYCIKY